jgi:uridine phosphorylase
LFLIAGIAPGSVVITDTAVDSFFKPRFEQVILDNVVTRSTELDKELANDLFNCSREIPNVPTLIGHTMCTYDFYEGENCLHTREAVGKHRLLVIQTHDLY